MNFLAERTPRKEIPTIQKRIGVWINIEKIASILMILDR